MEDLLELLEEGKAFAAQEFLEGGTVSASALVVSDEDAVLLEMQSNGLESKQAFKRAVQEVIAKKGAFGVCIIAEIWYDTYPLHATTSAESLQRGEGLLVCAEDTQGRTVCALSHIDRESAEVLGDWKMLGSVEVHGLFTGFFRRVPPEMMN